jgi:hypothetical protein
MPESPLMVDQVLFLDLPTPPHVMIQKIFHNGILLLLYVLVAPTGVEQHVFLLNGKIT